jgi:hypothetical protein
MLLGGPEIESRWGRFFRTLYAGPGVHPASYTVGTGSFPGVKRPGRGIDNPPTSSAKVKEKVEVYPYSPSGLSCHVQEWTLRFTFTFYLSIIWCIQQCATDTTIN